MSILWNQLVGHKEQVSFIEVALKKKRLAQVFLLSGNPGVGKKLFALSIGQSLICKKSRNLFKNSILPCGECLDCLRLEEMKSEHLFLIQPEGEKEIQRKAILEIFDFIHLKSRFSLPRIILIDQAHRMNLSSANLLLKILEEPPKNSFLFLITDSFLNVLVTIRSRCQNLRFRNLYPEEMDQVLSSQKGSLKIEPWMLQSAQGHMEGLQTLVNERTLRKRAFSALRGILIDQDIELAFQLIEKDILDKEKSFRILFFWKQVLRDAYICKALNRRKEEMWIHRDEISLIREIGLKKSLDEIQDLFEAVQKLEGSILYNLNRILSFRNFSF